MPLLALGSSTTRPGFITRQPSSKNSFRHGPGESESLRVLGEEQKLASIMALGSKSPRGYLKSENGFLASAKLAYFDAPNRRAVYSRVLRIKHVPFLIVSFLGSHQDFVQSSGSVATRQSWEVVVGVTKGGIFPRRVPRQDTAEISRIGTLSFLWCSFRVKRVAFILQSFLFSSQSSLARPKASHVTLSKNGGPKKYTPGCLW